MDNDSFDNMVLKLGSQLSTAERESLEQQLAGYINHLLLHDFKQLIHLLYRVDVSESKLKELLRDHPHTDAGILISQLIIQRQEEKIKTRSSFQKKNDVDEEERW